MDLQLLIDFCRTHGLILTQSQIQAFEHFREALYEVNAHTNLTRVPKEECVIRHFIDSLLILDLLPEGIRVLDIGTGAGFPSWPLACARPDLKVTALDSSNKAVQFLTNQPLPNLRVLKSRAEEFPQKERFDVVTGRAIAPCGVQLELSAPFCKIGGNIVLFRTSSERDMVEQFPTKILGLALKEIKERVLPGTEMIRLFPVYEKIARTTKMYPRPWAKIKQSPLK